MGTVALMALVLQLTDSPLAVGGILTLRLLPAAVGAPLAAKAAGRWDRRRTMLAMDLTRAGMVFAIPFVRALWWIYLWGFLLEVASIVFLPARDSSIPDLVDGNEDLALANGLILGTSYGSIPIGAALFAAVAALPVQLAGRPYALVFFIDAATFVVSFLCIARLTQLGPSTAAEAEGDAHTDLRFRDAFAIPLVAAVMPAALGGVARTRRAVLARHRVRARRAARVRRRVRGADRAVRRRGGPGARRVATPPGGQPPRPHARRRALDRGGRRAVQPRARAVGRALRRGRLRRRCRVPLAAGMGAIQSSLDGRQRVLAFTAFHVVLRVGLAISAVGAGIAGDLLTNVHWPVVGTLQPARLVLLSAGILVFASASLVRVRGEDA